jgi:hypothetical protein
MKSFIFMNHHIKAKNSSEPWVTVQTAGKRIYANKVHIDGPSTICTGSLQAVGSHDVKAWIECEFEDVSVVE